MKSLIDAEKGQLPLWILLLLILSASCIHAQENTTLNESSGSTSTMTAMTEVTATAVVATTTHLLTSAPTEAGTTDLATAPYETTATTWATSASVTATGTVQAATTAPTTGETTAPNTITATVMITTTEAGNSTANSTTDNVTLAATTPTDPPTTTAASNATSQTTTSATTTVTAPSPTTTVSTTTTTKATTTTASTAPQNTQPSGTTSASTASQSTQPPTKTIDERVKAQWNETIYKLDFNKTSLNATLILQTSGDQLITAILNFYKSQNDSTLKVSVVDSKVTDVAKLILDGKPSVLNATLKNQFFANQSVNLHGFYAALSWFHDAVVNDVTNLQSFAELYAPLSSSVENGTTSGNDTATVLDGEGFILFILSRSTPEGLFQSICKAAMQEDISESICRTPQPTQAPLPGPAKLEATWQNLISSRNFTFLTAQQATQLKSVTSSNMTTGLITYVKNLPDNDIKALVATNVTLYVSGVLRKNGGNASGTIGAEATKALAGNTEREDVFYVYMNFMNKFLSDPSNFEATLKAYVQDGQSARRRKREVTCDKSEITADGLVCHIITTEGNNLTALVGAVCDELNGGNQCTSTVPDAVEPTSSPVAQGLSTGAIVGIAIGSLFGLLLILLIAFLIWKYCCSRKGTKVSQQPANVAFGDGAENGDTNHRMQTQSPSRASMAGHPPSANGSTEP